MEIIPLLPEHWPAVKAIYESGLATGNASFQTSAPPWEEWDAAHLEHSRLAALVPTDPGNAPRDSPIVGWAALTPVSGRCVYAGVAEVSVYVHTDSRGQGAGKALLHAHNRKRNKRHLDPASRDLPRKYRQPPAP